MFPLKTDTPFSREQVIEVTRAMLQIAHIDSAGLAEEVAMIGQFYDGFRQLNGGDWPEFTAISKDFSRGAVNADLFTAAEQREMLVATCIMVAYADGVMTGEELAALQSLAADLGIAGEGFEQILALVKDHMLQQLAGLPDTASIMAVARELG